MSTYDQVSTSEQDRLLFPSVSQSPERTHEVHLVSPEQERQSPDDQVNRSLWNDTVARIQALEDKFKEDTVALVQRNEEITKKLEGLEQGTAGLLPSKVNTLTAKVNKLDSTVEKAGEPLLPQDSYSFAVVSASGHSFFFASFGIFLLQIVTLTMLALDIVDRTNEGNPLSIPGGVDIPVRVSQFIALIITVISQDEVRQSISVMFNGYEVVEQGFGEAKTSCLAWCCSAIGRLLEGLLALAVTFMLLITVDSVRELLLNFTAVEFVSNVDNAVFLLSKWGFFGEQMKHEAESISNTKRTDEPETGGDGRSKCCCFLQSKCVWLVVIALAMFIPWIYVSVKQENGVYLPSTLYIQFGDDHSSTLGTFSGLYVIDGSSLFSVGRAEYVLHTTGAFNGSAKFSYCAGDRRWVFLYGNSINELLQVCNATNSWKINRNEITVRAISSETFAYDLTETVSATWFYRDHEIGRDVPLSYFSVRKHKCKEGEDSDRFTCDGDFFRCKDDWVGESCQFQEPCIALEVDERFNSFTGSRSWSGMYNITHNDEDNTTITQVYGRPVYVGNKTHQVTEQEIAKDLLFFTGRRWVLTHTDLFHEYENKTNRATQVLNDFKLGRFHAHWTSYSVAFFSEQVDINTPVDGPTPTGLTWFRSKAEGGGSDLSNSIGQPDFKHEEEAVLLCAICTSTNPCTGSDNNTNACTREGKCECNNGAKGRLCQITPEGDGRCNPDFNTAGYGYDGGDCCPKTCICRENECGTGMENNSFWWRLSPQKFVGFPHCKDPSQFCEVGISCWKPLTEFYGSMEGSKAGSYVTVSGNGAVVAMYEIGTKLVRVFKQDGKTWKQRGEPLKGGTVAFGSLVALSDLGSILAFAADQSVDYKLFRWEPTREAWSRLTSGDTSASKTTSSVALSSDGTVLATASSSAWSSADGSRSERFQHNVSIYEWIAGKAWSQLGSTIVLHAPTKQSGLSLSMSKDGFTIAIGHANDGRLGVYRYSPTREDWISFGPRLLHEDDDGNAYSVSLAGDGKSLAIGNPIDDVASVFVYNSSSSNWTIREPTINGETTSALGASVSLSDDAMFLAVGVPFPRPQEVGSSHVRVYQYNKSNSTWTRYASDLSVATNDMSGVSVAMSHDANILVFGAPAYDKHDSGMARVMWRAERQESVAPMSRMADIAEAKSANHTAITFKIHLDSTPWDTSLALDCNGGFSKTVPFDELAKVNETVVGALLLPKGDRCTFSIGDFEGDGICCSKSRNGYYQIYYGNETNTSNLLAEGGRLFGSREQVTFTVDPPTSLAAITIEANFSANSSLASMDLTCDGDVVQMRAPAGAFQKSHKLRSGTFQLPMGAECTVSFGGIPQNKSSGELVIYRRRRTRDKMTGDDGKFLSALRHGHVYFVVPGCHDCDPVPCESGSSILQLTMKQYFRDTFISLRGLNGSTILEKGLIAYFPNSTFIKHICVPKCFSFQSCAVEGGNETCSDEVTKDTFEISLDGERVDITNFDEDNFTMIGDCPTPTSSPTAIDECPVGEKSVRVTIQTDWYPQDTIWGIWEVIDDDLNEPTTELPRGGPYRNATYRDTVISNWTCVPEGLCLQFGIRDLSGNGLCCKYGRGMYTVFYDGEEIATGDSFGSFEASLPFGKCTSLPSPSPTFGSTEPQPSQSLMPSETFGPSVSVAPTSAPTMFEMPPVLGLESPPVSPEPSPCSNGTTPFRFEITMDRNPQDVSWMAHTFIDETVDGTAYLSDEASIDVVKRSYAEFIDSFQTYAYDLCVPDDQCTKFTLCDESGDGICCQYGNGSYSLYYNDTLLESGGKDFAVIERLVGSCNEVATPSPPPNSTTGSNCTDGYTLLRLELFTDRYPEETSFVITDDQGGSWVKGGPYVADANAFGHLVYQPCVPSDRCYTFTIFDSKNDGICCNTGEGHYRLSLEGEIILGKGNFTGKESKEIGSSCESESPTMVPPSEMPS